MGIPQDRFPPRCFNRWDTESSFRLSLSFYYCLFITVFYYCLLLLSFITVFFFVRFLLCLSLCLFASFCLFVCLFSFVSVWFCFSSPHSLKLFLLVFFFKEASKPDRRTVSDKWKILRVDSHSTVALKERRGKATEPGEVWTHNLCAR